MDPSIVASPQAWDFAKQVPLDKILSLAQLLILFFIIRWTLKTGHERETALAGIINLQLNTNTRSLDISNTTMAENTKSIEKMIVFLDQMDKNVRERWEFLREASRYQREEHQRILSALEKIK